MAARSIEAPRDAKVRQGTGRSWSLDFGRYLGRNPSLPIGLALLAVLVVFALVGQFFVTWDQAFPLSGPASRAPSARFPFGTDAKGRDLLAVMVYGTLLTLKIGVVAGALGVLIGKIGRAHV